ncbi:MAG TPA: succinylglutamate desuccinylase/aspartoacylase family protein [Candidatus Acidoferrales bacterium]|jgi:protein MpaA|nr:succinylglutamate desuccinylase/aspartoacylase family protein [Candidatus Acidoferrales bacterium]
MNGTYRDLELAWKGLRATHDLRVREVACVGAPRTLLCVDVGDHMLPGIALAAGIHGDEPAGPWALLGFVSEGKLDPRYSYRIWPCTNPTGFSAGTRESCDGVDLNRTFGRGGGSPEAKAILTANRDYAFALSIDLHEDRDASGFYCYEYGGAELGRAAVCALDEAGLPVDPMEDTFDLAGPLDDSSCERERGRIVADGGLEAAAIGGFSYNMLLARRAARHALTFETPLEAPWDVRLTMHHLAISAAIGALSRVS